MPKFFLLAVFCGASFGQTQFDVASIKTNDLAQRGGEGSRRQNIVANPGSLIMQNVTLKSAIQWAFNVREYQVSGPAWLNEERFDISGRAAAPAGEPQLRQMLQTLLSGRFKLAVHRETRDIPTYVLLVDKGGLKMHPAKAGETSNFQPQGLKMVATSTTIAQIADVLTTLSMQIPVLNVPVVDQTGVKDPFDFTMDGSEFLQNMRSLAKPGQDPQTDLIIEGVQQILKDQLGIRTELRKLPGELIVVDHIEKTPSEN